jgi:DnaJ-class molecular chaperone
MTDDGLVRCPDCNGTGRRGMERGARMIVRACGTCKGSPGRCLPESMTLLNYCRGDYPCCEETT